MNFTKNIRTAVSWLANNSTGDYVHVSSKSRIPYHEVTGYFIPTLLNFGFKDRAQSFADYLVSSQAECGAWTPHGSFSADRNFYVFDTAQVLDGLTEFGETYQPAINRAVNWLESKIKNERFEKVYMHPEIKDHIYLRVLYCLKKAGYDISRLLTVYDNPSIYKFDVLSHFYGYAFEGCARLGLDCTPFLNVIRQYDGKLPDREGSATYCTVGLAQISLSLFLCGEYDLGMKTLEFVSRFQNPSGGFFGSNGQYFPAEEISWANKFYLDAFQEGHRQWFIKNVHIFGSAFEAGDADKRLIFARENVRPTDKVLDVGCGKGRYINRLVCDRYACDIADASKYVNAKFSVGSYFRLPYPDSYFDVVLCAETLEHAIFTDRAILECLRVLKKGGKLLIIDKDKKIPFTDLHFGEEWLDFSQMTEEYNAEVAEITDRTLAYPFYSAKIIKQ